MKKKYLIGVSCLAACMSVSAQNLNQEVQVTNEYETRMTDATKSGVVMNVPDSLTKFNLHFDYSVFDNPYKGSYEFKPYAVEVTPDKASFTDNSFYLQAGLGYPLKPVLQAVWSPVSKGKFRFSFHQDLHGYLGGYRSLSNTKYSGYDLSENLGAEGRWNLSKLDIRWNVDYDGLFNKDNVLPAYYNSVGGKVNVRSNNNGEKYFFYDVTVGYRYSNDYLKQEFTPLNIGENTYSVYGCVGPVWNKTFRLLVDFNSTGSGYSRQYSAVSFNRIAPKVAFVLGPAEVSAGVNVDFCQGMNLYPDLHASVMIGERIAKVYADITGGVNAYDYSAFRRTNHWFNPAYIGAFQPEHRNLDARIGLCGSIVSRIQYNIRGGYVSYTSSPLLTLAWNGSSLYEGMSYADYGMGYIDLDLAWRSERLEVDGSMGLRHADIGEDGDVLTIPAFTGDLRATYNWMKRIFAGISVNGVTARKCASGKVPGYADLGLFGEFRYSRKLSFWAKAGNLLNVDVTTYPTHIPGGINFTAGICLNL